MVVTSNIHYKFASKIMIYNIKKDITQTDLLRTNTIDFHLRGQRRSDLLLELARTVLFFSSSPQTFILRMISSMVVPAPLGEVAKTHPVVRLATQKQHCVC